MAASGAAGKRRVLLGLDRRGLPARAWALALLCCTLNLLEAGLVAAFGDGTHPDLAPQASAVAPFGAFSDLRWVSVYHDSWAAAIAELLGVVVVRGSLTGLSIYFAWPFDRSPPHPARLVGRGMVATGLASLLLVPSVALLFGTAVVPVSWLFFAAVPTALLIAVVVHPIAVRGDWWRRVTSPRALGWVVAAFAVLSLASALMAASPAYSWPFIAVASGLFNARCWVGLVKAVATQRRARFVVPVGALTVVVLVAGVIGGTMLGFHASRNAAADEARSRLPVPASPYASEAVLVVSGYGSRWDGTPARAWDRYFEEERFSYKGLASSGLPLPYSGADTAKPLGELERMLLAQISVLYSRTGLPIAVVAESEGALIAKTALLARPQPEVVALVMASPLESPGRVWYPTGRSQGWGVASNEAMRLIGAAFQDVAPINLSPDNPFLASLDRDAPLLENAMACPLSGTRQVALLPLADATVSPATEKLPYPAIVVPAFHGGVLGSTEGTSAVREILEGRPLPSEGFLTLAHTVIGYASTAWQVPPLAPSDYPDGGALRAGALSCGQVARGLRKDMGR